MDNSFSNIYQITLKTHFPLFKALFCHIKSFKFQVKLHLNKEVAETVSICTPQIMISNWFVIKPPKKANQWKWCRDHRRTSKLMILPTARSNCVQDVTVLIVIWKYVGNSVIWNVQGAWNGSIGKIHAGLLKILIIL